METLNLIKLNIFTGWLTAITLFAFLGVAILTGEDTMTIGFLCGAGVSAVGWTISFYIDLYLENKKEKKKGEL